MNRGKITRLAFIIVFLCFFMSTFVSLWSLRMLGRQNMEELSKALASRIYDSISSQLSEPVIVSRTMSHDRFLRDMLRRENRYGDAEAAGTMKAYLAGLREGLKYETAFVVSAGSKRYYTSDGMSKVIHPGEDPRDAWYQEFLEKGTEYDLDVDRDEFAHDAWTVFVDTRIEDDDGTFLGVCGVGVRMRGSEDLFAELERDYGAEICLVDPQGLVKVDTDETRIEKVCLEGIALRKEGGYVFQQAGESRYAISKYIDKLGWYLVVQTDGRNESSQLIHVLLLNGGLCLLVMGVLVVAIRIIITRTRALTHASFRDQSTQLLNRRAFEEEKEQLAGMPLDPDFTYITADLNGLKTANDTQGHMAGDELIRGAAECLKECLEPYGKVFRIGGDEFAAILKVPEGKMEPLLGELEGKTAAWSGNTVKSLSISIGCARSREFPSENLAEIIRISDERMYAAKEKHYRETGKTRRVT